MQVHKLLKEASVLIKTKALKKPTPTGMNSFKKGDKKGSLRMSVLDVREAYARDLLKEKQENYF